MNIGKAIKELRKKQGLSQVELSANSGVTQTAISQIESGITRPHEQTLISLCKALKIPGVAMIYLCSIEESDIPEANKIYFNKVFPHIRGMIIEILTV